ncbi:dopamine beta-hydroxylase-like [Mya arenaria]|uniref:dopamine beta-hydroxylase-like n=1 Tax=Mya arenaria TaxID=6604 RepID=UPI0022E64F17|nr:dopamine beta-hydroxylase-like [Mya arenaria]
MRRQLEKNTDTRGEGEDVLTIKSFPYSLYLDSEHTIEVSWNVNYHKEEVECRIRANIRQGSEWFGMGFSDYGELANADFVIFWTSANGVHHFQDTHTDTSGNLHIDAHQDYDLQHAHTDEYSVSLEFSRLFDTCDDDDYQFDTGTTHLLYIIGAAPFKISNANLNQSKHGLQRVQLLKPDIPPNRLPGDMWTFEVTAPNIVVPAQDTTYWWYTVKIPPMRRKHHIIKYEGVIKKGNENLVHHMEVFHCELPANEIVRFYNGPGQSEGTPDGLGACRKVIGAWAMGAAAMEFPEEAGFPVGGPNYNRYVMLEIHYNNPSKAAGKTDTSGIRFYVTPTLRQYDAGIMELGLEYTNKMAIPPRQKLFQLTGYCISECTSVSIPPHGIHIYASQLHTHLTGKRVFTQHVRQGRELPELNRDNHYSPHFQEIRRLPKPVHVLPGDDLITTCADSTTDRENATIGGFAISDEMCVNYVHYYPQSDLEVCKSSVSTEALNNFFTFMKKWDRDAIDPHAGDRANYQAIRWTPLTNILLKTLYETSPIAMQCNKSDGSRYPGNWANSKKTDILLPYQKIDTHCKGHIQNMDLFDKTKRNVWAFAM